MKTDGNSYEGFWEEFNKIYPGGAGDIENVADYVGIEQFFRLLLDSFEGALKTSLSSLITLFGICIAAVALGYLAFDEKKSKLLEASALTVFSVLIFSLIKPLVFSIEESLNALLDFTGSLSPILSGIMLAYGSVNSAASQALNMNVATSIISFFSKNLLLPVSFAVFAFAMLSSISENEAPRTVKWLKNTFFTVFGIASALLFSSLALQNILAGAQDGVYIRTAKQMLSGMIPVVGSTISASLSSLMGAFTYVKSAVGTMSILLLVGLFLPAFFSLLLLRGALSLCQSFMEFASMGGGVRLFSAFLAGIDTLLAVYVLSFLCAMFGIVFFMKGGVQIFG